ncbi:HdeD family acid-resistance protein [Marinobacter sp. F4206]|uniref:HdeD family acid-resistance protein n=1 Tax=Marinobacter sp. F4206 TaxID=2861777 RepID=UPI001C60002F|nr:DUF308 domain-containing protein [Marinobacter sp. F4206]MBW4936115.1 DUF308 domain-containing protein [Marinobacter sp. F4206]
MRINHSTKYFWLGLLTMAPGVVVLFSAVFASAAIVSVIGIFLLLGGALQIALGFGKEETARKLLNWALGALMAFLGWTFMANPLAGLISLTTLLLILLAASSVIQIMFAFRVKHIKGTQSFWPLLLAGIISSALAIVLLSSPEATMALLGALLGLHMLAAGASLTIMGMLMRRTADQAN